MIAIEVLNLWYIFNNSHKHLILVANRFQALIVLVARRKFILDKSWIDFSVGYVKNFDNAVWFIKSSSDAINGL